MHGAGPRLHATLMARPPRARRWANCVNTRLLLSRRIATSLAAPTPQHAAPQHAAPQHAAPHHAAPHHAAPPPGTAHYPHYGAPVSHAQPPTYAAPPPAAPPHAERRAGGAPRPAAIALRAATACIQAATACIGCNRAHRLRPSVSRRRGRAARRRPNPNPNRGDHAQVCRLLVATAALHVVRLRGAPRRRARLRVS